MKGLVVALLLCAALFSSLLQGSECLFKKQKCGKIIASKFTNFFGRTPYCTYLCRSFPPKMERETDGTPCWSFRGKGTCQGGRCTTRAWKRVVTARPVPPRPKSSA
ncbi:uncharacterized protein LOC142574223 [Dermacentor variabilis]|uniref:uncharacterized protein LOC142574223 n=1 Tax=Dermacentor variabilis TaxID=34621 RepID=UPI003F5C948A